MAGRGMVGRRDLVRVNEWRVECVLEEWGPYYYRGRYNGERKRTFDDVTERIYTSTVPRRSLSRARARDSGPARTTIL